MDKMPGKICLLLKKKKNKGLIENKFYTLRLEKELEKLKLVMNEINSLRKFE